MDAYEEPLKQSSEEIHQLLVTEFAILKNHLSHECVPHNTQDLSSEYNMAVKKVELPLFAGDNPLRWINTTQTYFEVQGLSEELKITLANPSMEGATIP